MSSLFSYRFFAMKFMFMLLLYSNMLSAQNYSVTFSVGDSLTQMHLLKVIFVVDGKKVSYDEQRWGQYTFNSIKGGDHTFLIFNLGYKEKTTFFHLNSDTIISIFLSPLE